MKRFICNSILIIGILLIFISCTNHRSTEKPISQQTRTIEKKSPGRIVFEKEIHNFGRLKDGEIVSYSFRFHNKGGSPFSIVKAEKSCGCLEIHYCSKIVSPGDSSTLELILNTSGEWGNEIKSVIIKTSEGEHKELQVGAYIDNKQFNNLLNTEK